MSRLTRSWLIGVVLLLSCDGLGRPVVDRVRRGQMDPRDCEHPHPRCAQADAAPPELASETSAELPPCDLGADADAPRIVTTLRGCTLALAASDTEEREISSSSLDNVRIELARGAHLRIADSQLFRVTLVSQERADDEEPSLLQVTHSDLRVTQLSADQVELVSSFLDRSRVESSALSAVDVDVQKSILLAKAAVLSSCFLSATRVADCETLLIAGSKVLTSRFDACEELTRIYEVEATTCTFDGQLEVDTSTFVDNRFGVRAFTQMHGWGSSIQNATLCDGFDNLRFSGGSLTCVACQGPVAKRDPDVCVDTVRPTLNANDCPVLIDDPPICETYPRRPRPIIGP